MSKELAEAEHEAVDEREDEVYSGGAEERYCCGRLVENQRGRGAVIGVGGRRSFWRFHDVSEDGLVGEIEMWKNAWICRLWVDVVVSVGWLVWWGAE